MGPILENKNIIKELDEYIENPELYKEGNAKAGIKNWKNMSIFKIKFKEMLKKKGIQNINVFLEQQACDEEGSLYLDRAC